MDWLLVHCLPCIGVCAFEVLAKYISPSMAPGSLHSEPSIMKYLDIKWVGSSMKNWNKRHKSITWNRILNLKRVALYPWPGFLFRWFWLSHMYRVFYRLPNMKMNKTKFHTILHTWYHERLRWFFADAPHWMLVLEQYSHTSSQRWLTVEPHHQPRSLKLTSCNTAGLQCSYGTYVCLVHRLKRLNISQALNKLTFADVQR